MVVVGTSAGKVFTRSAEPISNNIQTRKSTSVINILKKRQKNDSFFFFIYLEI